MESETRRKAFVRANSALSWILGFMACYAILTSNWFALVIISLLSVWFVLFNAEAL